MANSSASSSGAGQSAQSNSDEIDMAQIAKSRKLKDAVLKMENAMWRVKALDETGTSSPNG
ncbi:hypothetical protein LTR16_000201 [Cryomyces antarcticus]|uniref:Uncharacterized protein n=1 Tax=Cryomyces antarcticus TaxID=329879 RepID=A0ABR0KUV6_9PEZI|nr:hypothetical protein LTR39_000421 [Cryomyces antarcticus]KAK5021057.1 hypothetical protein LTR60_000136 [Cryomyces antarcticus]KAK5131980.1 hypothetical protein LTR16_000201 [Cryomyces antarcticus]